MSLTLQFFRGVELVDVGRAARQILESEQYEFHFVDRVLHVEIVDGVLEFVNAF